MRIPSRRLHFQYRHVFLFHGIFPGRGLPFLQVRESLHASFFLSADILSPLLRKEGPETVPRMMEYGTCPSFPRKNGELAFHAGGFSPERLLFPEWRGRPFPTFFSLPAKGGGFCPCQNECRHYNMIMKKACCLAGWDWFCWPPWW